MKLLNRKALASAATVVALTASAFSVPVSALTLTNAAGEKIDITADTDCDKSFPITLDDNKIDQNKKARERCEKKVEELNQSSSDQLKELSRDDDGNISAKEIAAWIGLVGTVVTVLTSLLTFANKIPNLFGQ